MNEGTIVNEKWSNVQQSNCNCYILNMYYSTDLPENSSNFIKIEECLNSSRSEVRIMCLMCVILTFTIPFR